MGLRTLGDVEQIKRVQTRDGEPDAPTNESLQQRVVDALEGEDGLTQVEYTTSGTDAEELDSLAVPDGFEVLVEYRETNSGNVYLGDASTQKSALVQVGDGRTYAVADTSSIYVRTPTAGDGVIVTFEVSD